ncbi:hypothetical protein JNW88_24245 [Micromonospora sp. ATA32]|nr:hypothetical protein [Micromonospora sp. ATA32]
MHGGGGSQQLSSDPDRIDLDRVHHWLCTDAYWALGRDRGTVARAFAGSVPFGVYRPGDGAQVAVARTVTDPERWMQLYQRDGTVRPVTSKEPEGPSALTVEA